MAVAQVVDVQRWQMHTAVALVEVLAMASRSVLEPITWTVSAARPLLSGRCESQDEFAAWAGALAGRVAVEQRPGRKRLHAERPRKPDGVRVVVFVDITEEG